MPDATDSPAPLSRGDVFELLHRARQALTGELSALPEAVLRWHPAPGQWCAKEVLGHLIEAERRGFAGRIREILAGEAPLLTPWDQDAVARERRDCERDIADLCTDFIELRGGSMKLVRELREADLGRLGRHPVVGDLRVSDLLHEWVHHDREHLRQILANVQAAVWPHMGHARRFSAPGAP